MKTNYHPTGKGPRRAVTGTMGSIAAREGGAPLLVLAAALALGVGLAAALFLDFAAREAEAQTATSTKIGVVAWGYNEHGEANVPAGARAQITAIAAGGYHSLALKEGGSVVAWGKNWEGQTSVPSELTGVKAIAAGEQHSLALKEDGSVVAWGGNSHGQTSVPSELTGVKAIAAGDYHSLALKEDGSVTAWGYNDHGQVNVPDAAKDEVKAIAAGRSHSLALKENGSVVAWGYNSSGQSDVPDAAKGEVKAIAAGNHHNLALKENGSVIAWGYSFYGQANVPDTASSRVKAVAGGDDHSLALKEDGSVLAWGKNFYGQAGVPERAQGGVEAIAAGGSHNLVLKEDTTPPDTSIASGPSGRTDSASATFQFSSTEVGSTFQCSLDGGPFVACDSGKTYENLDDGPHAFEAYAVDAAGNADPTPVRREWTVDTGPPNTSIDSGPSGTTRGAMATFALSSTERASTFECSLDDAPFGPCDPQKTYENLADGFHVFEARAVDAVSNADPTPVRRTWSVDTVAPNTGIAEGPYGTVTSAAAAFEFLATEPSSTFECSLDGANFAACDSPEELKDLSDGPHTFRVRATDTAGNADDTPASRTWSVDAAAPNAPVITAPADGSLDADGSFVVRGTAEKGAVVRLYEGTARVGTDEADPESGAWRIVLADVSDGGHAYAATATDAAGNTSTSSEARTVVVDTTAPGRPAVTAPANGSYDTDGDITLSGTAEADSTVRVYEGAVLKGTATVGSNGSWSATLTGVGNGGHSYTVTAADAAGNLSAASAPMRVTVDKVGPAVSAVTPAGGAKNVAPGAGVTVTFYEAMSRSSVTGSTFTLVREGTTRRVPASVTLSADNRRAKLDPSANLTRGATYTATVTTGAEDLAGNPLARARTWSFTVKP